MKKTLLISALLLLFLSEAFPQVEIASPEMLVCPGESISYGAFPASVAGCSYKWTVTNGMFSNGSTTIEGYNLLDVTVIWNNVQATSNTSAPKGTLHVEVYGCALPTGESNNDSRNDIVIKTLNNVTPSAITGSANVGIYAGSVSYSIPKVVFPNTGTTNGWSSTIYADSYQWVIPLGWELDGMFSDGSTPITNQGNSVAVTPNDCGGNGSKIKVRAYSSCGPGYTSKWQELTISNPLGELNNCMF